MQTYIKMFRHDMSERSPDKQIIAFCQVVSCFQVNNYSGDFYDMEVSLLQY